VGIPDRASQTGSGNGGLRQGVRPGSSAQVAGVEAGREHIDLGRNICLVGRRAPDQKVVIKANTAVRPSFRDSGAFITIKCSLRTSSGIEQPSGPQPAGDASGAQCFL